ncbi:hypothetical protein AAHZ94_34960, partial [Streptomyces sp. HSW2009]
ARPGSEPAAPRRPGDRHGVAEAPGPDHRVPPHTAAAPAPSTGGGEVRGSRPCPRCRADNPYERRLCVRCGGELDRADPAPGRRRAPWWRRLFGRDRDRVLAAGSRPRPRPRPPPPGGGAGARGGGGGGGRRARPPRARPRPRPPGPP